MIYSGFWMRAFALILDTLLMLPVSLLFAYFEKQDNLFWAGFFGSIVFGWLYFSLFESGAWQATPGKRLMKIRVTSLQGERISFGRATGRYFAKILSAPILGIGYLMAAFTEKKQALYDMICETLVLKGNGDISKLSYSEPPRGFADPASPQDTLIINNTKPIDSNSGNWVLAGFDSDGRVIRLVFSQSDQRLSKTGIIIGRDSSLSDLCIQDQSISRRHARLYMSDGLLHIEDLGSTNGTIVSGKSLKNHDSAALHPHDILVIGGIEFSIGRS
jgi:uncharacterized RDD family membrane protein YckC